MFLGVLITGIPLSLVLGALLYFPFLPVEEKTPSFRPAPSDGICTDLLYHSGV